MKLFCCCAIGVGLTLTLSAQTQQPPPPKPAQRRAAPRPVSLTVIVRDQSGTPVGDARVTVMGPVNRQGATGTDGAVTFAGMRDGVYRLRFEQDRFVTLEREVTVKNGQPSEVDVALNAAPTPPPPPPRAEPPPAPPKTVPHGPSGPPVTLSIPSYLDKNFIGRDPLKESVLGCTGSATTRLLQLRDALAAHSHADLDEILYVIAGEGSIRVKDESTNLTAGSLSVVPRGLMHSIDRRGRNPLILLSTLAGAPCQPGSAAQSGKP